MQLYIWGRMSKSEEDTILSEMGSLRLDFYALKKKLKSLAMRLASIRSKLAKKNIMDADWKMRIILQRCRESDYKYIGNF